MCGIVGYSGARNAVRVLLEGLSALEYRGYDSAGVSVFTENGLQTVKSAGRLGGGGRTGWHPILCRDAAESAIPAGLRMANLPTPTPIRTERRG